MKEYIAEAVGSFIFFAIVLQKGEEKHPTMIAVALFIGILVASIASPAFLNPAISIMALMEGKITGIETISFIVAELIGALIAVLWFNYYTN